MAKPPDITELDRRPADARAADPRDRSLLKSKSLRLALDRAQRAWDQGYACAVDMLARLHADGVPTTEILENLRARIRHPQAHPVYSGGARGTHEGMVALRKPDDEPDTAPISVDDES